jgi:multiple sugar transport system substrate-binding protein
MSSLIAGAAALAGCSPQVITQVVTQMVKETQLVNVTSVVKETAMVEKLITATPAPGAADITGALDISWPNDAIFGPIYEAMWKQFQVIYPNIKLNMIWNGDQNKLIAAGTPPSLLNGGDVHPAELKMSLDLDPFIAKEKYDLSPFFQAAIDPLKIDGKLKGLAPWFNISLLYYNKKIFTDAKMDFPTDKWTKDQFLTAAKALTKNAGGKPTQWGVEMSHGWWGSWLIFVRQAGGDFMDTTTGKVTLDSPEAIAGMKYWVSLIQAGADKVSFLPKEDSLGGFQGDKIAMSYGSHTGNWNTFRSAGVDFDVAILPAGLKQQRGGEQALDGWSIHKDAKSPEAAWAAMKYICAFDTEFQYYSSVGPVTRKDVAAALTKTPVDQRTRAPHNLESIFSAFDQNFGMGLPRHLGFVDATQNHVQPVIDLILEGKNTVEDGMKEATKAAQDYLDSTYPDLKASTY